MMSDFEGVLLFLGTGELLVVLLVVLFFFGAERIPEFARGLGRFMRQVKDASNEIQRDIEQSVKDVNDDLKPPRLE